MKRHPYEPRIVGGKVVIMPADLQRVHQRLLNSAVIEVISDEMREGSGRRVARALPSAAAEDGRALPVKAATSGRLSSPQSAMLTILASSAWRGERAFGTGN